MELGFSGWSNPMCNSHSGFQRKGMIAAAPSRPAEQDSVGRLVPSLKSRVRRTRRRENLRALVMIVPLFAFLWGSDKA
jgi:hypothetical protein